MKTLQVDLGEILYKFSIIIFKSTQNFWFVSKLQKLNALSLIRMFKSI